MYWILIIIIIVLLAFISAKKLLIKRNKILTEDILKHSYYLLAENKEPNIYAIAGRSNIPAKKILKLIPELEQKKLIKYENGKILLTEKGLKKAISIIRAHRLYEKYLAEKTSIPKEEWHKLADKIEHELTQKDIEQLAKQLGFPIYDPHGDPIPTKDGTLPKLQWKRLNNIQTETIVQISHIEDEPEDIYNNIIKKKVAVGKLYKVININPITLKSITTGKTITLTKPETENINIVIAEPLIEEVFPLTMLKNDEIAEVVKISKDCPANTRRRFLELGFVRGAKVKIYLKSIFGEPIAYVIKDSYIALRKEQAEKILIKRIEQDFES